MISGPMEVADREKQSKIWRGNPNAVVIELEHEFCKLLPERLRLRHPRMLTKRSTLQKKNYGGLY